MKLATTTFDFDSVCSTYPERIRAVCAAGFRHIDLSLFEPREGDALVCREDWRDTVEELRRTADACGADFVQCHLPRVNPLAEGQFDFAVARTVRSIEVCAALGIPYAVIHAGFRENNTKEEFYAGNRRFFGAILPAAEKGGVCLLHENTTSVNFPWFIPKSGAEMKEFSDYIGHPLLHSCWDTGHGNCEGPQYDQLVAMGDDLRALHINDNRGKGDEHVAPFLGTVNMDDVMHGLIDSGYKGCFTFEANFTLRPSKYWQGDRRAFPSDTRLADAPYALFASYEKFLYDIGHHILSSYGLWED